MVEVGELIIAIRGDIADVQTKLNQVQEKISSVTKVTQGLADRIAMFGRSLRRAATILSIIGGSIVFAMVKLVQKAAEFDEGIAGAFEGIKNTVSPIAQEFALIVAETVIPIIAMFVEKLREVWDWFMNLSPVLRQNVIRGIFLAAAFALIAGTIAGVIASIAFVIGQFGRFFNAIRNLVTGAGGIGTLIAFIILLGLIWTGTFENMGGPVGNLFRFIRGGLFFLADTFANFFVIIGKGWGILWESMRLLFGTVVNNILTGVEDFVNLWIKGINTIISGLNKLPRVNITPLENIILPRLGIEEEARKALERIKNLQLPGFELSRRLAEERAGKGFTGPGGIFGPGGVLEQPKPLETQPAVEVNIDNLNVTNYRPDDMKQLVEEAGKIMADNINRSVVI